MKPTQSSPDPKTGSPGRHAALKGLGVALTLGVGRIVALDIGMRLWPSSYLDTSRFAGGIGHVLLVLPSTLAFCILAGMVTGLMIRGRRRAAGWVAGLYLLLWGLTAWVGTHQVERQLIEVMEGSRPDRPRRLETLDPSVVHGVNAGPAPPWTFVGNTSSPCPFVVGLDSVDSPPAGGAERLYFVWLFGITISVAYHPFWFN